MENKSNSNKVNRQRREKVLRFSIRKYSFGAASVAVAALMFLSGHQAVRVEAAQVSDTTEAPVIPDKEEAHTATIVDLPKTEDSLTTGKEEKSLTTAENPAETLSEKLPETSTENASENETTALDKEVVEKQTLDKTKLQANITKVQELLDKVNKEKAPASTLAAIQADLETANSVLNNNSLELTQAEIDAIAKKLNEKIFVLSSMPKINAPKKVLKEGENTIANTGSRDSRNGETMEEGSDLRSAPIDKTTKQGSLGIVVADSGFITGYATPSSTIEIKKNGQKILTSKLDDTGAFKLNAPGIKVGDRVELVVNGQSVYNTTVSKVDTVSFNDSLAGIAQVDGYTAAEADVEVSIGGRKYTTRSQSNGYFTVNVDTSLMKKDAVITTVVKKNGKEVGSGTSTVRETKVTDFGVGWNRNPMLNYSERDVFSPDTKQYAFVSKGTADKAYDNVRVYREERIEKDGNKYYYWMLDSGPAANARAGSSKKISLAIPRSVGDPYDFTYTKYVNGQQTSHEEYPSARDWEYKNSNYRAYVKNGERRSGSTVNENIMSWMDYIEPSNGWMYNIYRNSRDGANRNPDAATRVNDMLGIASNGLRYHLVKGVIEDKLYIAAGQRTIITFKTKVLEGNELDQSIMSDWVNKDKNNPMLADIKKRLANDPYLAYGGYTAGGYDRYKDGQNAIIGTLPLKPEEAERYNLKPKAKEQRTKVGVIPDAYNSIANPNELPAGTTYRWFKDPDVSRPTAPNAPVYGKVEVIIPERGTFIVDAPVHVVDDKAQTPVATAKDNGDVTAKPQDSTKVDKIKVNFTGEDNQPKTAEGKKGTNGKWTVNNPDVRIDANNGEITIPANKVKDLTEVTAITKNGNGADSDPAKAIAKDVQKPQATLNGVTLTETANSPIFTVYRGAEFNPELKVWDNSGKISKVNVGNLPYGVRPSSFTAQTGKDGSSEDKKYTTRLSSGRVIDTQTLGEHIGTLHVEGSSAADSRDLKFKYRVVDITTKNLENGIAKVPVGSTLNIANSPTNVDAHNYLKVVDSNDQRDRGNSYLPQGMVWTWKAGDNLDSGTTLDNSGKYTRNAVAKFPTGTNSITDTNSTTRTTFAPAEIKRQVVLAVTPTAPSVVANKDGSVEITPPKRPNSNNPQDIDTITLTYTPTGKTTPETVKVTKTGNNWTVNGKPTDKVSVTPQGVVKIADLEVADGKEISAKVSKTVDNNVVLESPVAKQNAKDAQKPTLTITPSSQTVVEGEKVEFTVTAKDNTSVTLDAKDFLNKYLGRMNAGKATTTPVKTTETEKVVRISITTSAEDISKQNTITFNAADNDGNNADPVNFNFTVTARDTVGPTITANGATVTKNEPIAPISVTAADNPGGVGLREKNPIEVTGLPTGLTYANNRITGTPTAGKGDYPVTITAYDKNGNHTTSNITIKVQEQADKYNPTGETLTVNQGQAISDDAVKAKVKNFAPGTLTVESKPASTATAGSAGNAVVKVTYPDGSHDTVTVPVTVRDVTGPTITAEETTVTKNEEITPIPITAEDNAGGVGMRETNPITVSNLPSGLTYSNGNITGKTSARKGFYTLTITAYDKNNTPSTKKVKINVQEQADKYTPTATELTVNQNEDITIEKLTPKVNNPGKGTLSLVSKPSTTTAGSAGNAVVKVTYSDGSHDLVNVPITVKDVTGPTITANNATVTNREDITPISVTAKDNTGGVGMRDTDPIVVTGLPAGLTYADGQITGKPTGTAGETTVTITAYDKNDNPTTTTIKITVQSQADAHNPRGERLTVDQNHVIEDSEVIAKVKDYAPATQLTVKSKPTTAVVGNPEDAVVTVTYPDGSSEDVNVPVTVRDTSVADTTGPTITANGATVTKNEPIDPISVTAEDNPGGVGMRDNDPIVVEGLPNGLTFKDGKITGTPTAPAGNYPVTIKAYDKIGNESEAPIKITIIVQEQKDKYTPTAEGLTVNQGHEITDDEVKAKVKDFAPGSLTVTSKPSTETTDNVPNAVVTVTYPDGSSETVDVPVTVKDVTGPTITADGATVTRNEPITPIPVNVSDNEGGRGLRDDNPVEVTGLPDGLTYANGEITGTPAKTAEKGGYTVTIKATDKDGNSTEKQITITVQTQADKYTPTGDGLKVDQGHTITDDEVTGKVKDNGPGELSVTSTPSTSTFGDAGNAIVKVTYPDGSTDEVKVPVTVSDVTGPKVTANGETVTKNEPITPIKVTVKDNEGGRGLREENPVEVTGLPDGLTYANGEITGTPTAPKGDYTVTIKAYDKDGNETTETITIKVQEQADKYNPTGEGLTVNQNHVIEDSEVIAKVKGNGPGTVTVVSKPSTSTKGNVGNAIAKVTYPDGSSEEVPVPVTVNDVTGPTITAEGATVTKNEPITPILVTVTENEGGSGLREENPVEVTDLPEGLTYANGQITGTPTGNKGDYTVTIKAHDKDGNVTTQTITITVQEQADKYNPKYDDGNGKPGAKVEVPVKEEAGKTIPEGTRFESLTPGITVDDKGKVTVTIPEDKEPGDEIPGTIKVTYPDGSKEEVPVKVTVTTPDRDIYTPEYDDGEGKPGGTVELPLKEEAGKTIPEGTKFESLTPGITVDDKGKVTVTIPGDKNPGDEISGTIKVTYPDGSKEEVPVRVTVTNKDKDIYTPEYDKGNGKPGGTVELPLKEKAGKEIPEGTKFQSDNPGITVGKDGTVTVTIPEGAKPGDKITGTITVTYPDGSKDEVPVEVTVREKDKDIYTPEYDKGNGKPGGTVELPLKEKAGKPIPEGTKFESDNPRITVGKDGKVTVTIPEGAKPGDKITGTITVTYPDGSKDEVPVEVTVREKDKDIYTPEYDKGNGKPGGTVELPLKEKAGKEIPEGTKFQSDNPGITVGKDGTVTVTIPEGAKPGDKITGTITVTYPDGSKDEVPVEVTVREKDKDIYTPEYDKGNGKPGGTVELPLKEKAGKEIPEGTKFQSDNPGITVGKDGKVTVTIPEGAKPGDKITGTITVTYPDGSKDEVPVEVTVREKDKDIYTPEYDKGNGKPGGTVELPLKEKAGKEIPEGTKFQSDTPGITVGKDGTVTITIPEGAKPGDKITGTITVTYPDGSKDEIPVEVTVREKDKDIYTPEYDKGNGKPGGNVELPLKEKAGKEIPEGTKFQSDTPGITVGKDGTVTITIPEGAKPGDKITGTITVTYPDGSKDEIPVEVTVREKDKDIYTPEYDKGNGKPGGNVELPLKEKAGKEIPEGTKFQSDNPGITVGKDGTVTVTIPEGAKPGDKITGTITVTYPDGSKDEVPVEVTVREKDKDIYTPEYDKGNGKPGGTVELPLKEKAGKEIPEGTKFQSDNPGITVGKDGTVTVTIPEGAKPGDKITGTITVTYPDGSKDEVPVEVTVREKDKDIYTPEYDKGNGKPGGTVELPLKEKAGKEIPEGTKFQSDNPGITVGKDGTVTVTIPEGAKPGDKITGTITVTYPDGSKDEVPVEVTVREKDKDIYTPEYDKGNGKPGGTVELPLKEKAGKEIPEGTKFQSDNPGITVGKDGTVTVTIPEGAKPGDKITGTITVTYPDGSKDEVPVEVTVREKDKDIYTPEYDKGNGKPGGTVELPLKEKAGKPIPEGTKFESDNPGITVGKDGKVTVTIPEGAKPGDKITGTITVTYPDGSKDEVPVEVTVREKDKDIYTPEYDKGNGKPGGTVELPLKEKAGKEIPEGTKFESDNPGITVGKDGTVIVTIPEGAKPGDKITGTITVTYPDGSKDEVPVEVTVREKDKDIYTPEYDKGNGKPGGTVELPLKEKAGKPIPEGTKFESDNPGITVGKDGTVTVTIPEGAKPGDKITGTITVTYPDGSKDEVPVEVTVREKDKDIYTPEYDKGNGKPGGTVELPLKEKAGKEIPEGTTFQSDNPGITVGKDGTVTVTIPEGAKPGDKITGTITVTYPDGSKDEVPVEVTVREKDKDIYTPEYDKGNGKPGGTVELPLKEKAGKPIPEGTKFESDNPGITVGKDGTVTVTIPEGAKPGDKITGTITVTYPDGSKDEVPVEVTVREKDKDIYTPEYDKGNGKPGGTVELPLKEKAGKEIPEGTTFQSDNPGITVGKDGKVTVTIPEGAKPGDKITGTITVTYPDGSKDEVPVEVTVREKDKDIYTPEYDKGNGKPGTKVEIPVAPDTNGGSGQDTPAPATPIPNAVTPNADQVDTKTTVDNGAKSNDSQNVLPNTGTESNAALASLGLLGLLSGFGLVARKKKED